MWRSRLKPVVEVVSVALGAYAAVIGGARLGEFRILAPATQIYYVTSFAAGAALAVLGAVILISLRSSRAVVVFATFAMAVLALNQNAGLAMQSIICFTPV